MKHTLFTLLTLVLLAGTVGAQNMLTDPGFESGGTGWTICPSGRFGCGFHTPNAHSGADALCAEGCCGNWGDHTGGWQDVLGMDAGTPYDVWGWAKGCDDVPDTAEYPTDASVGYGGACGAAPTTIIGTNTTCSYTQYATVVSGVTSLRFYFYGEPHANWSASSVHWDDAYVAPVAVDDWVLY